MTTAVSGVAKRTQTRPKSASARRALDLVLVVVSAPFWVPAMLFIGVGVAVSSGLPVLFKQERTGTNQTPFVMLKFRSMTTGPNPLIPSDNSITKIGRVLRKTSLDELPQLLNVLNGDMSLVGPRPMLPTQSCRLSAAQRTRHDVAPGMTGLAQVSGRNSLTWEQRIELDQRWAKEPTVRSYVRILLRTFAVVADTSSTTGHPTSDPFVNTAPHTGAPK